MNYFQRAYALGVKEANATFKPVGPPKPSAPAKNVLPDKPVGMAPMKPAATPKIDIKPPTPLTAQAPQMPAMPQIAQQSIANSVNTANNMGAKIMTPGVNVNAKISEDIAPDNGVQQHQPETNQDGTVDRRVSQGFDALRTTKDVDFTADTSEGAYL